MKNQIKYVSKNNLDIEILLKIAKIFDGKDRLSAELTVDNFINFKYVSNSSVDVERNFSTCENMLSDNQRMFCILKY